MILIGVILHRDDAHPRTHMLPTKNSNVKCSISPLELLVRIVPETSKTIYTIAIALDYSPELDDKTLW